MSWNTEKLGNLLAPSGYDRGGSNDYPVLSITMHGGLVDQAAKFKKRVASSDTSTYRVAYVNELVVGFPIDEGVLGFQTRYPAAVVSPAYSIWKLKNPTETHIPFVQSYLRSSEARRIYASKMRGAVARRRSISREDFLDIDIPFPPLEKQKRIAAVLDKADVLRRRRQESLELPDTLLQSVFIEMFGTEKEPRCARARLSDYLDFITSGGRGWSKYYADDGDKFIRSLDVRMNEIDDSEMIRVQAPRNKEADRTRTRVGDVLLTITGSLIGRAAPVSERHSGAYVSQHVAILRTHGFVPEFLAWAISTEEGQRQIQRHQTGQTKPGLNFEQIGRLLIPRPTEAAESTFTQLIQRRHTLLVEQREAVDQTERLLASIQQRAFRGELDLSRLKLDEEAETSAITREPEPGVIQGRYKRPGSFIAPPDIEAQMMALESKLAKGPDESIQWSEDYFMYRTLSQVLKPPFSFADIWNAVEHDFEEPSYETVKDKIFAYVEEGTLEQRFDEERKEIVFHPHT